MGVCHLCGPTFCGFRASAPNLTSLFIPAYIATRRRNGGPTGGMRHLGSLALVVAGLVGDGGGRGGVNAQFFDGGPVSMVCGACTCEGSSDDGSITVFDNPSSGERIASVEGEYSEILESSCGKSVIAVGSTVYELTDVDLERRNLEAVEMSPSGCDNVDTPSTADCYSGSSSTQSLDGGIKLDVTLTYGKYTEGSTFYRSNVNMAITGTNEVDSSIGDICIGFGFVTQLFSVTVDANTYLYNFEFALPDDTTSADLSVGGAASSSAGAFACGELEPTPSPPAVITTDAPVAVVVSDTPAPAAVQVANTTSPVVADTFSPTPGPIDGVDETDGSAAPTTATGTGGNGNGTEPESTMAPSAAVLEETACVLPEGDACTEKASLGHINSGIGAYYDLECNTTLALEGGVSGCDDTGANLCRKCLFNTPLWKDVNQGEELPDFVNCPCCVLAVYERDTAADESGVRCENVSPAPTVLGATPSPLISDQRGIETLSFDDRGWTINSGEGVALAALGIFGALTFLPLCSK